MNRSTDKGELISKKVWIPASDGFQLSALVLRPTQLETKAVIQFHAGTVLKKEFYLKYAQFLAHCGFVVVLFDYRGVGESRPKSLRGFEASISDWGRLDAPGILEWIQKEFEGLPIYLFAHSMGGQILGLMPNWKLFKRIVLVASSSGNWHNFKKGYARKVKWSSNILFPIVLPTVGYAIGRFGLGADWPKGVAMEWWQNCRQNGLMAGYMRSKYSDTYYHEIDSRIKAYFFADDHMATELTVPNLQLSYPNAKVITEVIHPEQFDLKEIGHFGLFKDWSRGRLWEYVVEGFG